MDHDAMDIDGDELYALPHAVDSHKLARNAHEHNAEEQLTEESDAELSDDDGSDASLYDRSSESSRDEELRLSSDGSEDEQTAGMADSQAEGLEYDGNLDADEDTQLHTMLDGHMLLDDSSLGTSLQESFEDFNTRTKNELTDMDVTGLDAELLNEEWPASTLVVLDRIHNRGRESLIPSAWQWDFRFLPDILFQPSDVDVSAYIHTLRSDGNSYATKALTDLFHMAAKARDRGRTKPEAEIRRFISRYALWAMFDAGFAKTKSMLRRMPKLLISHASATPAQSGEQLEAAMRSRFAKLERRWVKVLDPHYSPSQGNTLNFVSQLPIFYGFMISHTMMACCAMNHAVLEPRFNLVRVR